MSKKQKTFAVRLTLAELRYCLAAFRVSQKRDLFLRTRSRINVLLEKNDDSYETLDMLVSETRDLESKMFSND